MLKVPFTFSIKLFNKFGCTEIMQNSETIGSPTLKLTITLDFKETEEKNFKPGQSKLSLIKFPSNISGLVVKLYYDDGNFIRKPVNDTTGDFIINILPFSSLSLEYQYADKEYDIEFMIN